jgi:E-phenylitaconyl-CoA hydratase
MAIKLRISNGVALVKIDRPEAMNSIDPTTAAELVGIWRQISEDSGIRVGVISGEGEKAFCTGSDLKKTAPPVDSFARLHFGIEGRTSIASLRSRKPVIAAINGYALGGGLELALQCDIRVASETATFGLPEVCIGSIPGAGGTQRLMRCINRSDAMLMLLSGQRIDAKEALRIGLVSRLFAPDSLLDSAMEIAAKIAANAPLAVAAAKRLAEDGVEVPLAVGLELEQQAFGILRDSADRLEGRRAFAAKERPQFTGS